MSSRHNSAQTTLPLVPWEQYMLLDDTRRGPMTFLCRLGFAGQLDRQRLLRAITVVLDRHPLLAARVTDRGGRFHWDLTFRPAHRLHDLQPSTHVPFAGNKLDLFAENGFRVGIFEGGEQGQLWFEFHHAACDGLGAIQAIGEIIAAYHDKADELPAPATLEQLANRSDVAMKGLDGVTRLNKDLGRIARFFLHRIETWEKRDQHDATTFQTSGLVTHRFSTQETDSLLASVHGQDVTFNDLLLRDLYVSLLARMSERREKGIKAIRIAVPISHRLPHDGVGAVNRVSMVFLDRTARQIRQSESLLSSIARETAHIKKHRMGIAMLRALKYLSWNRRLLRYVVRHPRSNVTCILTNLGVVPDWTTYAQGKDDGIECGWIDVLAPVRPQSPVSIGVFTLRGSLTLALRHDLAVVSTDDATELLGRYVDQLRRSIGAPVPTACSTNFSADHS